MVENFSCYVFTEATDTSLIRKKNKKWFRRCRYNLFRHITKIEVWWDRLVNFPCSDSVHFHFWCASSVQSLSWRMWAQPFMCVSHKCPLTLFSFIIKHRKLFWTAGKKSWKKNVEGGLKLRLVWRKRSGLLSIFLSVIKATVCLKYLKHFWNNEI